MLFVHTSGTPEICLLPAGMVDKNKLVLYPCRSAAVRIGRGSTARPPEAEWSSVVAAFWGRCFNQDMFKDPKKRHDHLSVLYNKDIYYICERFPTAGNEGGDNTLFKK